MKKIASSLILGSLLIALPVMANQGLAFIHGTGNQTDAYNDYWTGSFVNSVRQGLNDPAKYTVINCDFDQYIPKLLGTAGFQREFKWSNTRHLLKKMVIPLSK